MAEQPTLDFEAALKELNTIVESMEKSDLNLETALAQFERGVALTRTCQTALKEAEQFVAILTQKNGVESLSPFKDEQEPL